MLFLEVIGALVFRGIFLGLGVRLLRKVWPITDDCHGTKFFLKEAGKRFATPLLSVVVTIEAADLVFAVDSEPGVLAVSGVKLFLQGRAQGHQLGDPGDPVATQPRGDRAGHGGGHGGQHQAPAAGC